MDFLYKLDVLKNNLRGRGFFKTLTEKIIPYLFKPIDNLIQKNRSLIEIKYGFFSKFKKNIFPHLSNFKIRKLYQSDLSKKVREFWYSNNLGNFILGEEVVSRKEIFLYGGPNSSFNCQICQKSEWLSRVKQKKMFISHLCDSSKECEILCNRQGNDAWTQFHQNFDFALDCQNSLPAPKCLYVTNANVDTEYFFSPGCGHWTLLFRRRLAYVCQIEAVAEVKNVDWKNYDFMLIVLNTGKNYKFSKPPIPVIAYAQDFSLQDKGFQWTLDWLEPDVLLTPYPTQWKENFKFSSETKIAFYPIFDSLFFSRPNLGEKKLDLLVVGAIANPVYAPRRELNKQISELVSRYKIEFSNRVGALDSLWQGPVYSEEDRNKEPVRYLNKWSEYLGSAKYVTFGRIGSPHHQFLLGKYYEILGSGAIPIFPEVPDSKILGIKPFEHYIPLSEIEGNNEKLTYFFDHYQDFKYIAQNAVNWYKDNSDRMIFKDFEKIIRETTGYKYPERLI